MTPSLTSEKELSGKELVEHLAFQQLSGTEIEKNIFWAHSLGEKSLSLRKSSLEKKNSCILIFELMFLAFFAALGLMIFDRQSFQQREPVAAYCDRMSLQLDELVAAYSTDRFQTQSLQPDELEAAYSTETSFQTQSLQQEQLVATYLAQTSSLQQNDLVDHSAQLCNIESVQSFSASTSPAVQRTVVNHELSAFN